MSTVVDTARKQKDQYAGDADRPLGSYLGTLADAPTEEVPA